MIASGLNVSTNLVLEKAGLIPPSEKKRKINPLLESAVEEIARHNDKKQILAAKIIRTLAED